MGPSRLYGTKFFPIGQLNIAYKLDEIKVFLYLSKHIMQKLLH